VPRRSIFVFGKGLFRAPCRYFRDQPHFYLLTSKVFSFLVVQASRTFCVVKRLLRYSPPYFILPHPASLFLARLCQPPSQTVGTSLSCPPNSCLPWAQFRFGVRFSTRGSCSVLLSPLSRSSPFSRSPQRPPAVAPLPNPLLSPSFSTARTRPPVSRVSPPSPVASFPRDLVCRFFHNDSCSSRPSLSDSLLPCSFPELSS